MEFGGFPVGVPFVAAEKRMPASAAANLWEDDADLFERLRRRVGSYSLNTQRALAADWRAWRAWCATVGCTAFPAAAADLVEYVLAHSPAMQRDASGGVRLDRRAGGAAVRRASTVKRWLASLSTLHRIADRVDPTRDEDVKAVVRMVSRGRNAPEQKAPLRWGDVEAAVALLGEGLRDLRAKALITVAYSTLARRAELISLEVGDISWGLEGDGTVTLKTKGGEYKERYLAPEACRVLELWLEKANIRDGKVFRRLERHGGVGERTLNAAEVARTFKRIAGIIGAGSKRRVADISAHSTRIGAAQDLTAAGAALAEIMVAGGWKSPQMPAHYARKLSTRQGAMRRWLDVARKRGG
jgi:integrase